MFDERTRTQLFRFVVVGGTATACDAALDGLLLATVLAPDAYGTARTFSFALGTVISYVLHSAWTYETRQRTARRLSPSSEARAAR